MLLRLPPRRIEPERLDDADVPPGERAAAYRGLDRLQRLSRTALRLVRAAQPAMQDKIVHGERIKWVDLACGSGRVLCDAADSAARFYAMGLEAIGVDFSEASLAIARGNAERSCQAVSWVHADLIADPFPVACRRADVISCSLFLHHLQDDEIVGLLRRAAANCRVLVVDDLRRSRRGYWLAQLAGRVVTRSPIVHADGAKSVRAALRPEELRDLADAAGLTDATITTQWPQRMLLVNDRGPDALTIAAGESTTIQLPADDDTAIETVSHAGRGADAEPAAKPAERSQ